MSFDLEAGNQILARTPGTLDALLRDLPDEWVRATEGGESWSPFDVVGHLVHGERTDWIPRIRIILEHGDARPFDPFDRFAQFETSTGKTLGDLLDEFAVLRGENLDALRALPIGSQDWNRKGRHPELGTVTLAELLATWVAHDLGHVGQIVRTMARQLAGAVGPWRAYLPILGPGGADRPPR